MSEAMKRDQREPQTVAEAYLLALKARGVDYLFGNAGTDFAPIIEGLARGAEAGLDLPEAIEIIEDVDISGRKITTLAAL